MTLKLATGNLLDTKAEALVNTVNTVGIMGKGIALQFKRAFPDNFKAYSAACKEGRVQVGKMFVHERNGFDAPHFIINFPTKTDWRHPSQLQYVEQGLADLIAVVRQHNIRSIAVPPLGCGNGGLDWRIVRPMIERAFAQVPDVQVLLFQPVGAPEPEEMPSATAPKKLNLTLLRALVVRLIQMYNAEGYTLGRLEAQKLVYFLKAAGQPMDLKYIPYKYGPYAHQLRFVLEGLEGHYISGLGDGNSRARIRIIKDALPEVFETTSSDPEVKQRLDRVAELIDGFETPYGMELLSTVHWAAKEGGASSVDEALLYISQWSNRKAHMMNRDHVQAAWEQLDELGWL